MAMYTMPHSSENTSQDIRPTKANTDETPSQPETKQTTKFTGQQFSEANKYTEQQSSENASLMASTEKDN
jgi:hypothetical protein